MCLKNELSKQKLRVVLAISIDQLIRMHSEPDSSFRPLIFSENSIISINLKLAKAIVHRSVSSRCGPIANAQFSSFLCLRFATKSLPVAFELTRSKCTIRVKTSYSAR